MSDANQALQALLQPAALKGTLFPPASRYHGIDTATLQTADGGKTIYIRRRFLPQAESLALLREHVVSEGERLDNVTALYLGDPEQFWRVCDGNNAMRPDELTETTGQRLRITLPAGMPGIPNA